MQAKHDNNSCDPKQLDSVLISLSLKNDALVKASSEQLTFKQLQKARKGAHVTLNIKGKITRALNLCVGEERFTTKDLFNYGS